MPVCFPPHRGKQRRWRKEGDETKGHHPASPDRHGGGGRGRSRFAGDRSRGGNELVALCRRGRRRRRPRGLTAARQIVKAGRSVIVLEARDRVGGRSSTTRSATATMPSSAACSTDRRRTASRRCASEVGVGTFPTYNTGNNVFWANGRRLEYPNNTPLGTAPPDPVVAGDIALGRGAARPDVDGASPSTAPWSSRQRRGVGPPDARHLAARATRAAATSSWRSRPPPPKAIFGCEPRDLSLLYTLFYIAASGNEQNPGTFERNFNTGGGAQESRFTGGAQTIPLKVAASSEAASC